MSGVGERERREGREERERWGEEVRDERDWNNLRGG